MLEFLQAADDAARAAGNVLRGWASRFTVREKSRSNLVTEADLASQQAIYDLLHRRFPRHGFCGEEDLMQKGDDPDYRWIIDPLDGTTNYVHGFPYYAVSIALEHQGQIIVGVVYDPTSEEMFAATRGGGATLNRRPLHCSAIDELSRAFLIGSLPVSTNPADTAVQRFLRMLPHAQTVQRTGSAALNLAYVAAGRVDGFWSSSLKPWDMAAGVLLVEEAGGQITKVDGSSFVVDEPDVLSSNGTAIHAEMSKLLRVV